MAEELSVTDLDDVDPPATITSTESAEPEGTGPWLFVPVAWLVYNGSDRKTRKPSIRPSCDPRLAALPEGTLIEFELKVKESDDPALTGEARKNSHYYFMRRTRLPEGWPDLPNGRDYLLWFRVIGCDDPENPGRLIRFDAVPNREDA